MISGGLFSIFQMKESVDTPATQAVALEAVLTLVEYMYRPGYLVHTFALPSGGKDLSDKIEIETVGMMRYTQT
jgi:hypothetical protein